MPWCIGTTPPITLASQGIKIRVSKKTISKNILRIININLRGFFQKVRKNDYRGYVDSQASY